ncbi:MAG: tetratricopeptide repeat protein [Phaeodactylibacter sp.]|nr:tetratricopeptide repeat protein [Phaeodactylibacter sp.]MCB9264355.1 tetratricopeptide repeat protein [Lewinellaceae bacterium]MCB9286056.1 tetratricopeptide repeat protein [Lewinellaceae bacterium]
MLKILLVLAGCFPLVALSQVGGQVNEEEVNIQKVFIDANRERLLGNYDNAIALLKEILKKDPKNAAAAFELARAYEATEEDEKAIKSAKNSVDWDPQNTWYLKFLADLYQKLNRNEEAAEIYERIVRLEPNDEFNYFRWAYFLVRADEINDALKAYDLLEKRIGVNEEVIRRKHSLYLGTGDNKKAARELERLIEAFPNDMEYRHLLAGFYQQIGEEDKAREVYQEILQLDPDNAKAQLAMAGGSGQPKGELQFLESLKPVFRQEGVDIDLKIGQLMPFIQRVADTGNQQLASAALELSTILEQVHPTEAKAYSASGDLLYYSGKKQEALEKYQKALELDDTVFLLWEQAMHIYKEEKQYQKLYEFSERAMDYFPNQAIAYFMHGLAAHELDRQQEALSSLQQALLMAGNNGFLKMQAQSGLGLVYNSLKQYDKSNQSFEAALSLNAKSPEVLSQYAYALAERGERLEKAREMAALANDILPKQPEYLFAYGWVLYRMEDYKKAREWMEKALLNGGEEDPDILEHYGDVLFQLNEAEQAIEYWKKALRQGSSSELLEKKIADKKLYE